MSIDGLDCAIGEGFGYFHPCSTEMIGAIVGFAAKAAGGYVLTGAVVLNGFTDSLGFNS